MNVQKTALIVRRGQKFPLEIFLNGYVPLGWWNSVWTTMPGMIQRKNQTKFPGRPKKSEKKILSKLFFQLPIRRQKCRFDNAATNFPPQIRHFLAQSRKLFHTVNILFLSTCSSGQLKCLLDDSVEKFRQSLKRFGSKCIFDDCWKISAGSSINFAWKTKLTWKTNTFLI